jgi:hypothetical protein
MSVRLPASRDQSVRTAAGSGSKLRQPGLVSNIRRFYGDHNCAVADSGRRIGRDSQPSSITDTDHQNELPPAPAAGAIQVAADWARAAIVPGCGNPGSPPSMPLGGGGRGLRGRCQGFARSDNTFHSHGRRCSRQYGCDSSRCCELQHQARVASHRIRLSIRMSVLLIAMMLNWTCKVSKLAIRIQRRSWCGCRHHHRLR